MPLQDDREYPFASVPGQDQIKEQYQKGALVTMCWHEVPPTADEPVAFMARRGTNAPTNLNTVQGQLTEAQYKGPAHAGHGIA